MRRDLDAKLCKNFPKIFTRRIVMDDSSEVFGFECGDGWFNIIYGACETIQDHINNSRRERMYTLRRFRAVSKARRHNDTKYIVQYLLRTNPYNASNQKAIMEMFTSNDEMLPIKAASPQVVAMQVKEKFGGLRFYTTVGDEYVDGVLSMAAYMSHCTCEVCGKEGHLRSGGWIRTLCDDHAKEYGYDE